MAAGPFANFGLSIGLLSVLFMIFGEAVVPARITAVLPNSPAATAGFARGDIVISAAGRKVESFADVSVEYYFGGQSEIEFWMSRE